ncbi:MAG TPA: DUF4389 domain-containing protein [Gammaproteobacteria bacterium]|nr:DUF4389 domain-containing protein [Gammaproteobacteria bacterium]
MSDEPRKIEEHLQSKSTWLRLFNMVILAICFGIAETVAIAVVLFQFFTVLFTGQRNLNVVRLGSSLSQYLYQITRYMTYNTEERPFPFGRWPEPEVVVVDEVDVETP